MMPFCKVRKPRHFDERITFEGELQGLYSYQAKGRLSQFYLDSSFIAVQRSCCQECPSTTCFAKEANAHCLRPTSACLMLMCKRVLARLEGALRFVC